MSDLAYKFTDGTFEDQEGKIEPAIYTPTHPAQFRCGQPAEIIGVKVVTPKGKEARPCFLVRWPDGFEDLSPIEDDDFTGQPTYTITK